MTGFSNRVVSRQEIAMMLKEVGTNLENKLEKILEQLEKQENTMRKISLLVSELHQDGKINDDTFNKLDQFLKEYYENPYDD